MNQSRKIIEILEGFKLGDMGGGKPNFVVLPEPPVEKHVEIIEKGYVEKRDPDGSVDILPWIFWEDPDGWKYLLQVYFEPTFVPLMEVPRSYGIMISCGKNLIIRDKKGLQWDKFGKSLWTGVSHTRELATVLSNITTQFRNYFQSVKEHDGVDPKTIRDFMNPIDHQRKNFEIWLKEKLNDEQSRKIS